MHDDESLFRSAFSRRGFITTAGLVSAGAALGSLVAEQPATAAPAPAATTAAAAPAPRVSGLHVQFGGDAATEAVVSWHTLSAVDGARVLTGPDGSRYERTVPAVTRSYTDAKSGRTVYAQHARLTGLRPGQQYVYAAVHERAEPEVGSFRTAPRGRTAFTFTSFGDQGTPTVGKRYTPPLA